MYAVAHSSSLCYFHYKFIVHTQNILELLYQICNFKVFCYLIYYFYKLALSFYFIGFAFIFFLLIPLLAISLLKFFLVLKVFTKCFESSPHVSHFTKYKKEYAEEVTAFLERVGMLQPVKDRAALSQRDYSKSKLQTYCIQNFQFEMFIQIRQKNDF